MSKLQILVGKVLDTLRLSLKRFPETLLISSAYVILMIVNNRNDYDPDQTLIKIALILALAIPISVAGILWIERQEKLKRPMVVRIGLNLSIIIYGILFKVFMPDDLDEKFMIRYATATAIAYLVFTLVPYLFNRRRYGLYLIKLLTTFLVTYLYTLVLYFGVIAIIFAVDRLFDMNISEDIYFDIFISSVGIFGLGYFLGKLPEIRDNLLDYLYPTVWRVLLTTIVIPLISIYTIVLYAYFIRIIVSVGWTEGLIGTLVVWYGYVSIVLLMLIKPKEKDSLFVKRFGTYYPMAMVLPMVMLVISIVIRIQTYGVTTLRATVFVSWIWFIVTLAYIIIRKKALHQYISLAFIFVFALAMFAPINIFSVTISNQTSRLEAILTENNMYNGDTIVSNDNLDKGTMRTISSQVQLLHELRAHSDIRGIDDDFDMKDMEEVFGFSYIGDYYVDDFGIRYLNFYADSREVVDIGGYDFYMNLMSRRQPEEVSIGDTDAFMEDNDFVLIHNDVEVLRFSLIEALEERNIDFDLLEGLDRPILIEGTSEGVTYKLVVSSLGGEIEDNQLSIHHIEGDVFFSMK